MLKPGEQIGDWIVVEVLGEGGMGAVFRCRNALSERIEAAVKVVKPHSLEHEMERFLREVEALDSLRHRAVVRVKGWGKDAAHGFLWLAMDLVTGEDLEKRLSRGPIPVDDARRIFAIVADALHDAHHHGIFHRDIKPANIILAADGSPRIVDFGIAVQKGRTRLTAMGTIPGTPAYMAPEIFGGEARPDPIKLDVYALGQVLCEAITGQHAFPDDDTTDLSTGQKLVALMGQKLKAEALDPGPAFPEGIRAVIRQATQPEPADRIGDMRLFVEGLTAAVPPTHGLQAPAGKSPETEWVTQRPPPAEPKAPEAKAVAPPSEKKVVPLPAKPPPEPQRSGAGAKVAIAGAAGLGVLLLGGGAVVLLAVVLAVVGAVAWRSVPGDTDTGGIGGWTDGAPVRHVQVAVTGISEGTPFDVSVDGLSPTAIEGMTWHFEDVLTGPRLVRVTAGPACVAAEAGPCGACCSCNEQTVTVSPGTDAQTVLMHMTTPPTAAPRAVRIQAPVVASGWTVFVDLGGATGPRGTRVDSRTKDYPKVQPGTYEARVEAGKCPVASQGCFPDGDCPDGCQSWKGTITVPCGTGTYVHTVDLPTPTGKPPVVTESETACRRTCPSGAHGGDPLYAGTRVKVTGIHEEDAYCGYPGIVGLTGTIGSEMHSNDGCWMGGDLLGDDGTYYYFYKASVKVLGGGSVAPAPAPDRFGDGRYVTSSIGVGNVLRIVDVHPDDAYYGWAGQLIGLYCTASSDLTAMDTGWFAGSLYCPDAGGDFYFYKVAVGP